MYYECIIMPVCILFSGCLMKGYNLYKINLCKQVDYVDNNWFTCLCYVTLNELYFLIIYLCLNIHCIIYFFNLNIFSFACRNYLLFFLKLTYEL